MTTFAIFRPPTAPDDGVPAVTTPERGSPPSRRERLRRWRRRVAGPSRQSMLETQHAVLERVLALLEAARADVSAGWAQDGWWATPTEGGQHVLATGLAAGASTPRGADAVCLVGALFRAGAAQGADSETGRAVDAVYEAMWESREHSGAITGMLTLSSPLVRQARIQALTRWNDAQGRTSDEVLLVLDRATARVMQTLVTLPAPRTAACAT